MKKVEYQNYLEGRRPIGLIVFNFYDSIVIHRIIYQTGPRKHATGVWRVKYKEPLKP